MKKSDSPRRPLDVIVRASAHHPTPKEPLMPRPNRLLVIGTLIALFIASISVHNWTSAQEKQKPRTVSGVVPVVVEIPAGGVLLADDSKTGGPASPLTTKDISLEQAHKVLEAAARKSDEIKTKMDIAVVDA